MEEESASSPTPQGYSEVSSTKIPPSPPPKTAKRNAFTELMSPKPSKTSEPPHHSSNGHSRKTTTSTSTELFIGRDGLGAYIKEPESFPESRVLYHNADFVAINDLFPKSSVHLLLLPRDPTKTRQHPFDAFANDPDFKTKVQQEATKLQTIAAKELQRRYGKDSVQDRTREQALDADDPPDELPQGRDWNVEVVVGVHAVPSMNHLHIHIISKDRFSDRLKHRKHYNSFATPFFVPLGDLPLAEDDPRRDTRKENYLGWDMRCWRCGRNFKNQFLKLKEHLAEEFEDWKKT